MRQYVYAIFWGALIGFLAYTGLKVVKFKTNTVRLVTAVIIGVSVFTMVGLQVERFGTNSTSGINIVSASYGSNVDPAQVGNRTTVFQGLANGKQAFNTTFDYTATGGDPVPGRAKDLQITYTCNGESAIKSVSLSAEAHSQPLSIICTPSVVTPSVVTPTVVTPPVVTPPPVAPPPPVAAPPVAPPPSVAPPPDIFPAAPVATGLGSSSLTAASGLAPLSGSGSGSARSTGPNMNEIYVTEPGPCGALNGRIGPNGLCGLYPY
jgi:hypothetical protein